LTDELTPRPARGPATLLRIVGGALAVVAVMVGMVLLVEHDASGQALDIDQSIGTLLSQYGYLAGFALIYIEESGVPLFIPGDAFLLYVGHRLPPNLPVFLLAEVGFVIAVTFGATNLYLISRRWGGRLVRGRLGSLIHLSPRRLATAERWFSRWGALAIIFGRHIPGFRVPITVAVGIFGVPYRTFVFGVTISTAVWAGFWLWVGAHFGARIGHFLGGHRWAYLVVGVVILALIAAAITRMVRAEEPAPADE